MDGGATWTEAHLVGARRRVRVAGLAHEWDGRRPASTLWCRATDEGGHASRSSRRGTTTASANNMVQRVRVSVR